MKTAFVIFFALVMTTNAFAQGGSYDALGAVKNQVKEFISVVNSTSATVLTKGMVVCFDVTSDDGIAVDLCGTAGFKAAGVVASASCAVGARCLLQTKGYFADVLFKYVATTNSVVGGTLFATTDGKAYRASPAAGLEPIGIALDASASADGALEMILSF